MLTQLTIKNYALIKHLEVHPSGTLNVITGETGAGKSILLGALGLLLGNRADTKVLWDETEKCVAEGTFEIGDLGMKQLFENAELDYEKTTVIRREISANGKSRAFINDTPVTLEVMKRIGSRLMDIHSQHETLELGSNVFQLHLIDTFATNHKLRDEYAVSWKDFNLARKAYEGLVQEAATLREEADFVKFQLNELTKADLKENEQAELESQLSLLEHAEDIKTRFAAILTRIGNTDSSVSSTLAEVRGQLNPIASFSPSYQQIFDRIESARIELNDIADEIENEERKIELDPKKIEQVKDRLSTLYQLQQKHRVREVHELIALRNSLQLKAEKTINLDASINAAKSQLDSVTSNLLATAKALTKSREKVFTSLCNRIVTLLKELGIPDARMAVEKQEVEPGPSGAESIELLFSANKGIPPRPLGQVASGGEFSRVMFAAKYVLAEKTSLPTLILDEIDTGVSGEIAIRLGAMMKAMSAHHQIIAISHLPQIAAKADAHYFVYKDNAAKKTITHIRQLDQADRIEEIAKMIGGAKPSSLALENARELMDQ